MLYDVDNRPGPFKDKLITATVIIKPAGSSQLEESRVLAVRHLVAGAIAGLKPENVTVSDLNGRTWHGDWRQQNADGSGPTGPAVGPGGVEASAAAEESAEPQPATSRPRPTSAEDAWHWSAQSWRTLALVGAALVCLLALRSMVRAQPAARRAAIAAATPRRQRNRAKCLRRTGAGRCRPAARRWTSELSKLVENDPETAASILRNWIGQVS